MKSLIRSKNDASKGRDNAIKLTRLKPRDVEKDRSKAYAYIFK